MERKITGSAQHHPEVELEVVGIGLLRLDTNTRWPGDWVGFESFKCRLCGHTLDNPDIGEVCECGCVVCTLIKFNYDLQAETVWERETLE